MTGEVWNDPAKLRKIAQITLGGDEEDEEDDDMTGDKDKNIPDFYLPLLAQFIRANPHETNFIVEFAEKGKPQRGGNGFGAITCMDNYCWRDIVLDADPDRLDGGRKDGFGSFFNYEHHCLTDGGHIKGRNERLKKKGITPPVAVSRAQPASAATSSATSSTFPLRPLNTNVGATRVKEEKPDPPNPLAGSSFGSYRSRPAPPSSDPIYISDGDSDPEDSGVQLLSEDQVPADMRKVSNKAHPIAILDDDDSTPTRPSARSAVAPHPFFTSSQNSQGSASAAASASHPSHTPSMATLGVAGAPMPETLLAPLNAIPTTWLDNEIRHNVNALDAVTSKYKTNPALPRLVDALRQSHRETLVYVFERSLFTRLMRQYKNDNRIRPALEARYNTLATLAQSFGQTGEYPKPDLVALCCGGKDLSDLWEKYVQKPTPAVAPLAPRSEPVRPPPGPSNLNAKPPIDDASYDNPNVWSGGMSAAWADWIARRRAKKDKGKTPTAPDTKPIVAGTSAWQANAVAGPSRPLPFPGRIGAPVDTKPSAAQLAFDRIVGNTIPKWEEVDDDFGMGMPGGFPLNIRPGALPYDDGPQGLAGLDDGYNLGYEWDRPVNAEGFANLFKTALDDFASDATVDDALKELNLTRIDERVPELKCTLMPHQIIGVAWMKKQEAKTSCAGGILGDQMGLGKTVQTIATMVINPSPERKIRSTLILVPVALLGQWKEEIEAKSNLTVLIYHGQKRTKSANVLKSVDVVLSTYSIVASEAAGLMEPPKKRKRRQDDFVDDDEDDDRRIQKKPGLLFKVHWYRLVLDECAVIRNKSTRAHKACMLLEGDIKWCLGGTLIHNSLNDVYAYLRFIGILDWEEFREKVTRVANRQPRLASKRTQAFLRKCMLRRTKESELNGVKLLQLPPKTIDMVELDFTPEEREIYTAIESAARVKVSRFFRRGTLLRNYSIVLVMLMRLRQLTCHPWLLRATDEYQDMNCVPVEEEEEPVEGEQPDAALSDEDERARAIKEQGEAWVAKIEKTLQDRYVSMTEDKDYGEEQPDENANDCPICFEALAEERVTACGHSFCGECIEGILSGPLRGDVDEAHDAMLNRGARPCPLCRSEVSRKHLYRATALFNPDEWDDGDDDISEAEEDDEFEEIDELGEDVEDSKPDIKGKRRAVAKGRGAKRRKLGKKKEDATIDGEEEVLGGLGGVDIEDVIPSTKMKMVGDIVANIREVDPTQKILIFSTFVSFLDLVALYLGRQGIRYLMYSGKQKQSEREDNVRAFSAPGGPEVMLMSLKAGAVGLNLTAANQVIMLDLAWTPATEAQAVDRSHRIGQTRPVTVKRVVVRDTVEQRILALQEKKQGLMDGAMGEGGVGRLPRLSAVELLNLFGRDDGHD